MTRPSPLGKMRLSGILTHGAAFILPIVILLFGMWRAGLYPFGKLSILISDMAIQYVDIFSWLKNVLTGDASLFYSFSKSIGGNMIGLFAYYVGNPLNFLVAAFPREYIQEFLWGLTLLKLALCGLTFSIFIRYRTKLPPLFVVMLSVCYAVMQYTVAEASNIMWIDGVIWLPLVAMGVNKLIHQEKSLLLIASLLLCILSNWYTAYMVCLFTVLYYVYEEAVFHNFLWRENRRRLTKRFFHFGFVGILAGAGSAFLLMPTIVSLLQGKGQLESGWWQPGFRLPVVETLKSLFIANPRSENMPALYCGMLVALLCVLYFLNSSIARKERAATGLLLGFLIFSMCFYPLERFWNGMRTVLSDYCRFSFIVSFLLIVIAAISLSRLAALTWKNLTVGFAIIAVTGLLLDSTKGFPNQSYAYASIIIVGIFAVLLFYVIKNKEQAQRRRLLTAACVCLTLLELALNTQVMLRAQYRVRSVSQYSHYVRESERQFTELKSMDNSWFRTEKTYNRLSDKPSQYVAPTGESLSMGYYGLSHYSSSFDTNVTRLFADLGYCSDSDLATVYNEPVLLTDSLLGVRYVSSYSRPAGFEDIGLTPTAAGQTFYKNPYALPLGYAADAAVLSPPKRGNDPFQYQNAFISAIMGEEIACFKPLKIKAVDSDENTLSWQTTAPAGVPVYGYVAAEPLVQAKLFVDDIYKRQYMSWLSYGVFSLGESDNPHTYTVRLEDKISKDSDYTCFAYYLDMPVFEAAMARLRETGFQPLEMRDGYLEGNYQAEKDGHLLLTIPTAQGWTVKINGEVAEPKTAWNALTAIPVKAGNNHIAMSFLSPGFKPGVVISLATVAAVAVYTIVRRSRRKKTNSEDK